MPPRPTTAIGKWSWVPAIGRKFTQLAADMELRLLNGSTQRLQQRQVSQPTADHHRNAARNDVRV